MITSSVYLKWGGKWAVTKYTNSKTALLKKSKHCFKNVCHTKREPSRIHQHMSNIHSVTGKDLILVKTFCLNVLYTQQQQNCFYVLDGIQLKRITYYLCLHSKDKALCLFWLHMNMWKATSTTPSPYKFAFVRKPAFTKMLLISGKFILKLQYIP